MSLIREPASEGQRSSVDQIKTSPRQPANMASSLSTSPPQSFSPLHQRKDDHAHRKRNRIVVWFLIGDPFNDLVVLRSMSKKKIEM